MISITFSGSASEVLSEMQQLVAAHGVSPIGGATPADAEPAARRGRGKKTEEVQPPTAPQDEGNAATSGGGAPDTTASGDVTKDTLSPRILQLSSKSGTQAVSDLFKEFGAAKFSELPADKYGAVNARLDELLAA